MSPVVRHRMTRRITCTLAFETTLLMLGMVGLASHLGLPMDGTALWLTVAIALVFPLLVQAGFWAFGLYSRSSIYSGTRVLRNLAGVSAFLLLTLAPPIWLLSRWAGIGLLEIVRVMTVGMIAFLALVTAGRMMVLRFFNNGGQYGRILLVGTNACTREVISEGRLNHGRSLELTGILGEELDVGEHIEGVDVLGGVADIERVVREQRIQTILLTMSCFDPDLPLDFLMRCRLRGINIIDCGNFYEAVAQKILLEREEVLTSFILQANSRNRWNWLAKEGTDKLLSLSLLLITALPMLVVALLVKLTSPGPVIYRQSRIGCGGRPFMVLKFRTMCQDAEKNTGATWACRNDPRVTPLGRFLRRTRIDELPQLFNILRGEMAFVGPRPERPEFVAQLEETIPDYGYRHLIKPGLTGWAQICYAYAATVDASREKLRYDLYYLKNMSIFLDLVIVFCTARAVVLGQGVR